MGELKGDFAEQAAWNRCSPSFNENFSLDIHCNRHMRCSSEVLIACPISAATDVQITVYLIGTDIKRANLEKIFSRRLEIAGGQWSGNCAIRWTQPQILIS